MSRFIHRRILPGLECLVFSFTLITITAGMKIINPKNVSWLQDGDGTAELSWEFFRRQSLFQFPIGKNPNYGLEISNSIAFDGAIPLMSLILRPFSFLMGILQFPFSSILPLKSRLKSSDSITNRAWEFESDAPSILTLHSNISVLSVYNLYIIDQF